MRVWRGQYRPSCSAEARQSGLYRWPSQARKKSSVASSHQVQYSKKLEKMPLGRPSGFGIAALTDSDLKAIFAYLKSMKPVQNPVPGPIPPKGP